MDSKLTIVLKSHAPDLKRATLCVKSIDLLFKDDDLQELIIIVPKANIISFKDACKSTHHIRIVDENTLCNVSCQGGLKQQIIKLYAAKIVKTKYYLVVDSDTFLTKKIAWSDLYYNNKVISNFIPRRWLENRLIPTCAFLNYDFDKIGAVVLDATLNIWVTNVCLKLINEYDVCNAIMSKQCTECALYYCYFVKNYEIGDFYHMNKPINSRGLYVERYLKKLTTILVAGVYEEEYPEKLTLKEFIDRQFNCKETIFSLIQGNITTIKVEDYYDYVYSNILNASGNSDPSSVTSYFLSQL